MVHPAWSATASKTRAQVAGPVDEARARRFHPPIWYISTRPVPVWVSSPSRMMRVRSSL